MQTVQIFGVKGSSASRAAERFCKERLIRFQYRIAAQIQNFRSNQILRPSRHSSYCDVKSLKPNLSKVNFRASCQSYSTAYVRPIKTAPPARAESERRVICHCGPTVKRLGSAGVTLHLHNDVLSGLGPFSPHPPDRAIIAVCLCIRAVLSVRRNSPNRSAAR